MKYKAVIFDLDGTMYDSSGLARHLILKNLFRIRVLSAERKCRHEIAGKSFPDKESLYCELFRLISERTCKSPESIRRWYFDRYLLQQAQILEKHMSPRPWVGSSLSLLRQKGVKTVCFSDYAAVEKKLSALGISPSSFDLVIDAPSAGGLKPCRESFLKVAQLIGTDPKDIIVVGDREDTDGAGAALSGMDFYLLKD